MTMLSHVGLDRIPIGSVVRDHQLSAGANRRRGALITQ